MGFAGVVATVDLEEAVKGVDIAVMVGGFPRKAGMERKDVMSKNVSIYQSQAAALEKGANKGVKVHGRSNAPKQSTLPCWCESVEKTSSIPGGRIPGVEPGTSRIRSKNLKPLDQIR